LRIEDKKGILEKRQFITQSVRDFFCSRNFLEVETPCRIPAPIPETHIDSVASGTWFLHASPEICMKRLLAAGYERLFQICKCYREGERGSRHLPEFTLLEWYRSHSDYTDLMADCEALVAYIVPSLGKGEELSYQKETLDIRPPWERLTVDEAFRLYASMSLDEAINTERFEEILTDEVEPFLGIRKPTFLYDYPLPLASLARRKKSNPLLAERFELYLFGMELANGFSELTDPAEQQRRFAETAQERSHWGKPNHPVPEPFLRDLAKMPEAAGIALGLDRMIMILTDTNIIDDVVAFTPEML
jgi:lysyl-tRNA synthetase class 2